MVVGLSGESIREPIRLRTRMAYCRPLADRFNTLCIHCRPRQILSAQPYRQQDSISTHALQGTDIDTLETGGAARSDGR